MEKDHLYEEFENLNDFVKVKPNAVKELEKLLFKFKFGPEDASDNLPLGYVGLLPEENQPQANRSLNESLKRLINILRKEKKGN